MTGLSVGRVQSGRYRRRGTTKNEKRVIEQSVKTRSRAGSPARDNCISGIADAMLDYCASISIKCLVGFVLVSVSSVPFSPLCSVVRILLLSVFIH